MGLIFGEPYGAFPRLYSEMIGYQTDGYYYVWKRILMCADDDLLESILSALKNGNGVRNVILLSAICGGYDGMGKVFGKSGKLKRSARRFAYHAIETIDTVCLLAEVNMDSVADAVSIRSFRGLALHIQNGFSWLTPPSRTYSNGPLTDEESLLANSFVITGGVGPDNLMVPGIHLIADNYEELKPYFKLIHSSNDKSVDRLRALLETRPALALVSGAL